MNRPVACLLLVLFIGAPVLAADKPADATLARAKVREAVGHAANKNAPCMVSHRMEVAGNAPDEAKTAPDYLELRRHGCPSDDKRAASTVPAGR